MLDWIDPDSSIVKLLCFEVEETFSEHAFAVSCHDLVEENGIIDLLIDRRAWIYFEVMAVILDDRYIKDWVEFCLTARVLFRQISLLVFWLTSDHLHL